MAVYCSCGQKTWVTFGEPSLQLITSVSVKYNYPSFPPKCSLGQMTPLKCSIKLKFYFYEKDLEVPKRFHIKYVYELTFSQINMGLSAGHLNAIRLIRLQTKKI